MAAGTLMQINALHLKCGETAADRNMVAIDMQLIGNRHGPIQAHDR